MKCILLVRVSTESQSLEEQEKELVSLASKYGYSLNDIKAIAYKESAIKLKEEERVGLSEMYALLDTGEYDCVFAWEISRIARKKTTLFKILENLIERKVQLIIKEPSITLLNPDGQINEAAEIVFTLFAQLAESEMRNKMVRFKRGRKEGFNKGKYMGGNIKLGYCVNKEGFWEVDEEGANIVRTIYELYNSGNYSLTELRKELCSRGYFSNISILSVNKKIHEILRDPVYMGIRTSNNILPAIIDKDTWEKCAKKRKENKQIPKARHQCLLNKLIRCQCGYSYSLHYYDGTYCCRIRTASIVKGIKHSPAIKASFIESLTWYVALQELYQEMSIEHENIIEHCEQEIKTYKEKIEFSNRLIKSTIERRSDLDEAFYINMRMTKERYEELSQKQNDTIIKEQANIKKYNQLIVNLNQQILNTTTFDIMFEKLSSSFDELKNGTDFETMKTIIHRYIKDIYISPVEGKLTSFWKKVKINTFNENVKQIKIEELKEKGIVEAPLLFKNEFYADVFHHKAYWDLEMKYEVPFVFIDTIPIKRNGRSKKGVKKTIKNHQYN